MGARSKGCLTCKSRRVKCDERHPKCLRCENSNFECAGYPLAFVDERPRIERACQVAKLQQRDMQIAQHSFQQLSHTGRLKGSPPLSPELASAMPISAFKDNIFISFLVAKMFEGRAPCLFDYTSTQCAPGWWITEMTKAPNKSLDALATMGFAIFHGLRDEMTYSVKLYGEALQGLRNALVNGDAVWKFDTLAAVTALCMYEVHFPSNLYLEVGLLNPQCLQLVANRLGRGWGQHADGLGRLLELRGPWRHKKFPEKSVLLEHRCILVSFSWNLRMRCGY